MLRENLRREAEALRVAARGSCRRARLLARLRVEEVRKELDEERRYQASLKRAERRRPSRAISRERREESDDEVRRNIPPELSPLFERVKRSIRGGPRMSRTEAFLRYAEENPGEELEGIEEKTDALIRELERRQRAG